MPHPFRLEPPVALRGTLHRDRLLDHLRARWNVQVLVVSAPAGFGKTTLLAEAVTENEAAPVGIDCWLACEPDDATVSSLATGLCEAVEAGPAPLDSVERAASAVTAAMWRRSPQQVALIIDDVQHVPPGSSAAHLLASIITSLPANAHLVLACRGEPPVPLARVEVAGGVRRIGQDLLSFTPEELDRFADLRGVSSREVATSDGWPALAELAASARSDATADYISEEVLAGLDSSERRDLALLAHLGPFDDELAEAALGRTTDVRALTADLPLVTEVPSGERTLHALWQSFLAAEVGPEEIADARRRAAEVLVGRDRLPAAMRLLMDAGAWSAVADVAVRALGAAHPPVPHDVLAGWLARLPPDVRDRPGGRLLSAIVSVEADPQGAWERFEDVARRFRAEGHAAGELACIVQLGQLAWWSESSDQLAALVGRVFELEAEGCPDAIPLACLGRALVIDLLNDSRGVLAALDRMPPASLNDVWQGVVTWLRSTSLMHLGHAAPALAAAEDALLHAGPLHEPLAEGARLQALCFLGHVDTVAEELPRLVARMDVAGYRNYTAITAAQCATLLALLGQRQPAANYLATAIEAAADPPAPLVETDLAIARGAVAVDAGDESVAADILSDHVARHPLGIGHSAAPQQRTLSLFYVLVPGSRTHWDTADLGPAFVVARDLARAVVALRAGLDVPATLTCLPAPGVVRAHLPLRWVAELAVAATAAGREGGAALLDEVANAARPRVVELAKGPKGHLRRAARAALTELGAPPAGRFELRLLGPVELRRAGMLIGAPEWRRPRVRKLLGYLTLHGAVSREQLAEDLWPDLAWEAQSRNLRVTLTYLLRVLEPQRAPRDPSYFMRTQGSTLALHAGEHLSVDVWEFDALGTEAVRADGERRPSEVLEISLRAVELWRGEPSELLDEPWAVLQLEQRRLRFASVATRAGELLLAQGNSVAAHTLASRALTIDPWLEGAHRLIVAAHRSTGDERAARHALARYRELIEELGISPDEATQMVERLVDLVPA